jgi:holo-[acyl-carrier protein] synthase
LIIGIGIDSVEVSRIEAILKKKHASRFLNRVYTEEEIRLCLGKARPAESLAARFAAKEALAKALGTGFSRGMKPNQCQILQAENTLPTVVLTEAALDMYSRFGVKRIHVSLTHTHSTATAVVIIES